MSGVWSPRAVPPEAGTRQRLAPGAARLAEPFEFLEDVQRHVLRALREPTSFVGVAPIGTGKFTAQLMGAVSHDALVWRVPPGAVVHTRSALAELGGAAIVSAFDEAPVGEAPRVVLVSDLHLAPDPVFELERVHERFPGVSIVASAEPDARARAWAEWIAQRQGRCGFVDATPWSTTRWRLLAPWRDTFAAEDPAARGRAFSQAARESARTAWYVQGRDQAMELAVELLEDAALVEPEASASPVDASWWRVEVEHGGVGRLRPDEAIVVSRTFDVPWIGREGTATGVRGEARPALAVVCEDAVDVLLGACVLQRLRAGELVGPEALGDDALAWVDLVSGETLPRSLYLAVAGLATNRGHAGAWVRWAHQTSRAVVERQLRERLATARG